ncbi:hypothetical protein ACFVT1_14235 [Streptomyces sp. NPDC057963]|uniref:hypothetical protein n=1 Tax=Streptomyces sp. NPDC057963 TaxID=3346290 RepID=UPI0036E0A808
MAEFRDPHHTHHPLEPATPHHTTDDALSLIAHRLNLARLPPRAHDPLHVFLTHTRH